MSTFKNVCIFLVGAGAGFAGGYFLRKYQEREAEKTVEMEIKEFRRAYDELVKQKKEIEKRLQAVDREFAEKKALDVPVTDLTDTIARITKQAPPKQKTEEEKKKLLPRDLKKKMVQYDKVKPSLESLIREKREEDALPKWTEDNPDWATLQEREREKALLEADREGKTEVEIIIPGQGSEAFLRKEIHEIVSYDDDLPPGYDEGILEFYMHDEMLISEGENEVSIDYTIGDEAYRLAKREGGEIYVLNHRDQTLYEVRCLDESWEQVHNYPVYPMEEYEDERDGEPELNDNIPVNRLKEVQKEVEKYENFVRRSKPREES